MQVLNQNGREHWTLKSVLFDLFTRGNTVQSVTDTHCFDRCSDLFDQTFAGRQADVYDACVRFMLQYIDS